MALIVGIHNTGTLSSAAILRDGKLAFGCAEERLSRVKYDKAFPMSAIERGLKEIGASMGDVDAFAVGWNPGINIAGRYRAGFSEWPGYPGARLYSNANRLLPRVGDDDLVDTEQVFHRADGSKTTLHYVTHHLAHCANAYFLSGHDEAAILSVDGYGERASTVCAVGRGGRIEVLRETRFPHSVGGFYSAITEHLGFRPDLDEWKVMGAAAYGDPARYRDAMSRLIQADADGVAELNLDYFQHYDFDTPGLLLPKVEALIGPRRDPEAELTQAHYDLAAAAQESVEAILSATLRWLRERTGLDTVCLTGGVAQNVVFNGKATLDGTFDEVFVPFAPDDSGNSIGAAILAAQRMGDAPDVGGADSFLGTAYDDAAIEAALRRFKVSYHRPDGLADAIAARLADGRVVGLFHGRMEFGQRALGHRSILADPRSAGMKDTVNAAVKFREGFRPFAPAVLAEKADAYFICPAGVSSRFMERALPVRDTARAVIPAVVHKDGTARLQTVAVSGDEPLRAILEAFGRETGVPVLMNTSFNINGEPIVESPADAVRTFFSSGLDALAIGPFLIEKGAAE